MSAHAATATLTGAAKAGERGHRIRLAAGAAAMVCLFLALAVYGADYYLLDAMQRPHTAKHPVLRSSGMVGLKLGFLGFLMFCVIFLYPLRKRWAWLGRQGSSKHWLDFHVLLGLTAPVVIAFHSSFKMRGIAGMAFWIMVAVALSGIVGRYLYAQIPRNLNAAEVSLKELQEARDALVSQLSGQQLFSAADLAPLFHLPGSEEVRRASTLWTICLMLAIDLARPFHIVRLRQRALSWGEWLGSLGGVLQSSNHRLEHAIETARRQAAVQKRILFLSRAHDVFRLWHVVHRPFSYSFVVLTGTHIVVALLLGFVWG